MSLCTSCDENTGKNTGRPSEAKPFGVVGQLIAMAEFASDGTRNAINLSTPLDQAFLDARLNDTDVSKRWYMINDVEEFAVATSEPSYQTFGSGRKVKTSEGVSSVSLILPSTVAGYYGQISNLGSCGNMSIFAVDTCGNIRGSKKIAGFLTPLKVMPNTFDAILLWTTDTTEQNTDVKFDFDKKELAKNYVHIYAESVTANLSEAEGLLDVAITNVVATASNDTIVFDVKENYGNAVDLTGVKGLAIPDFVIVINAVTVTLTSVTQDVSTGLYTAVTSNDILVGQVGTVSLSKNGLIASSVAFTSEA